MRARPLPRYRLVAADVPNYVKATASYTAPEDSGKSAEVVTSGAIAANNNEPEFSSMAATRTLPENSEEENVVGGTITALDDDSGDILTYSLTGTDAGSFEIDSSDQIKAKADVTHNFDFESTKKSYSITVSVSDSKGAAGDMESPPVIDDTIVVTINLSDVNEPLDITSTGTSHSAPSFAEIEFDVDDADLTAMEYVVETYTALDPDAGFTLTWSVSGTD